MNTNEKIEKLNFKIQTLEADNMIYRDMIKNKEKQIQNLRTRLRRANLELKVIKDVKMK